MVFSRLAPPALCFALCVAHARTAQGAAAAEYALEWSAVPAAAVPSEIAVTGDSSCACDLTLGGCDGNCCCDTDCAPEEQTLFSCDCSTGEGCLAEAPPAPSIQYCNPQAQFHKVNLGGSDYAAVYRAASSGDFLSDQLCVTADNNPALGRFFSDPTAEGYTDTQGAEDSTAAAAARPSAFADAAAEAADDATSEITFQVGSPLPAAVGAVAATAVAAPRGGYMALPGAAFGAACVDSARPVRFMVDASAAACERVVNAASCDAGGAFDAATYGSFFVASNAAPAAALVAVQVASAVSVDADTGLRTVLNVAALPVPVLGVDGACADAVTAATYTIGYSADGTIASASVALELSATPAGALAAAVTYSATFENAALGGVERPASGSPGYDEGAAVLAGGRANSPSADGRTAVAQYIGGLAVPGAANDGSCSPAAAVAARFGGTAVSSCAKSHTLDELRAMCQGLSAGGRPPSEALAAGWFGFDGAAETYVAQWANANAHNIADWVAVNVESPALSQAEWSEDARACRNMPVGFKVQLLTALKGPTTDPQAKVAYARLVWSYGAWEFSDAAAADAGQPESFYLQHAVETLVVAQDDPEGVLPSNPPLLPRLDSGILYPFRS